MGVGKGLVAGNEQYEAIQNVDRGRLIMPHGDIISVILITRIIFQQLIAEKYGDAFLTLANKRSIVMHLATDVVHLDLVFQNKNCIEHTSTLLK